MEYLETLCREPLWNNSISWDTVNPNLSKCFRHTFLLWLPYSFLFICSSAEVINIIKTGKSWAPGKYNLKSKLFQSRIAIIMVLMLLVVMEAGTASYQMEVMTPMDYSYFGLYLIMLLINFSTVYIERCISKKTSSSFQFPFWTLLTICLIPTAKIAVEFLMSSPDVPAEVITATLQLVQVTCCATLVILELLPYKTSSEYSEESTSFASKITNCWLNPLFKLGFNIKVPLDVKDYPLPRNDTRIEEILSNFYHHWNVEGHQKQEGEEVNIVPTLVKVYGPSMLKGASIRLLSDIFYFLLPQVLRLFVKEISKEKYSNSNSNNTDEFIWRSYFLATILSLVAFSHVTALSAYYHCMYSIGIRMRTAMFSIIYKKSLNLSSAATFTVGEISNYMSVDCERFASFVQNLNLIWAGPLHIIVTAFLLYDLVGVSAFAGLSVLLLFVPVNVVSMKYAQKLEQKLLKAKDKRVHVLNEAILGIKALKLYAWEIPFIKKVMAIREMEVGYLKKCAIFWPTMTATFAVSPILVTLVTFTTYVFIDPEKNILTTEKVFACMALFNIIRAPIYMLPLGIMDFIKIIISIKRINTFLNCPEIQHNAISSELNDKGNAIEFHNASLSWNKKGPIALTNINLYLKTASLTAILGRVGSGKSSLLSGLLGEMELKEGRISKDSNIAFVSQQAWIQNQSLKDNIIFGRKFDEEKYASCLKCCALLADLSLLPAGDMTEIGENGINLSGGQKQRVSLARATYGDEDIVLLDDPLSAVDAHVAENLFTNCIGPRGILGGKTRVLVTHNLSFLDQMDRIILLEDGQIVADGTHEQLKESNDKLTLFVKSIEMLTKEEESQENVTDIIENFKHQAKNENEEFKLVKKEESSSDRVDIRHYISLFKKINVYLCLLITTLAIISACCNTYGTVLLSEWTDKMLALGGLLNMEDFIHFLKLFSLMVMLQGAFLYVEYLLHYRRCAHAAGLIHNGALEAVFHSSMAFFDSNPTGRILNRFSSDVAVLDQKIPRELSEGWYCIVTILVMFGLTAYLIPLVMVFFLPMAVLSGLIQVYYSRTKRQLQRIESISKSPIFSFFSETFQGANVIRAFGAQNRFEAENRNKISLHLHTSYINMVGTRWLNLRVDYLSCLIIFVVGILATSQSGTLSAGVVSMLVCYSITMIDFMSYAVRIICDLESDSVALERLNEYECLPSEGDWFVNEEAECKDDLLWHPIDGSVNFVNYSTRYREDLEDVIKNLNLDIRSEEKIGICGRTGAGKSSLTMALFRMTNATSGSITIAGRDISTLGLQELRSQITVVPQDPVLFSGTLRFNLDPTDTYKDCDILSSLKHVHLDLDLAHEVTEGGKNFSVGQRQLICLARALLRKTKILVLDEATAAMDAGTDQLIQATIADEFKHCTVLTVAHRLHTILNSDRIVVMDKGEMVECGEPQMLLHQPQSYFYKLCVDAGIV